MKVAICLPHQDIIPTATAFDVTALSAYHVHRHGYESYRLFTTSASILPMQRAMLVDAALSEGCDWLLWIDSDMRFPKDALDRLLKHDKPIVGCNYATRKIPVRPTAFRELGGQPVLCHTRANSTGLEEVAGMGMGFMLTNAEVFHKTPKPWFQFLYSTANDRYHGEDLFFLSRAAEQGFNAYVDHDLSKDIGHVGQLVFRHEHVEAVREMVAA